MPPSCRPPRRTVVLVAAVGLVAVAGSSEAAPPPFPALAFAGPQSATTGFPPVPVVAVVGQAVTLTNADVTSHDIVSKASRQVRVRYGKRYYTVRVPLFRSELAPSGTQRDVKGVVSLKPGSYEFYCSLHTAMKGTLIVQEAG